MSGLIPADPVGKFEQMHKIAEVLSFNELLPEHLRGRKGKNGKWQEFTEVQRRAICFSIVNAADLWGCNAFMLAEQSYSVHGKMDYAGAFYTALANTRANLATPLSFELSGSGNNRAVKVTGTFRGETEPRTVELDVKRGRAQGNAPTWETDPDQMLCYAGARRWVRRYAPQVLLGLVAEEITDDRPPETIGQTPEVVRADYAGLLEQAVTQEAVTELAGQINADGELSNDERRLFLEMGRNKFKQLANLPTDNFRRWEKTIKTESSNDRLIEILDEVLADVDLSAEEAKQLQTILNWRIDELKPEVPA